MRAPIRRIASCRSTLDFTLAAYPASEGTKCVRTRAAGRVVEIPRFAYFGKRDSRPLAAEDELDAHPLGLGVNSTAAAAPRSKQAFVFVRADGARGQREFAGKVRDGVCDRIGTERHCNASKRRRC